MPNEYSVRLPADIQDYLMPGEILPNEKNNGNIPRPEAIRLYHLRKAMKPEDLRIMKGAARKAKRLNAEIKNPGKIFGRQAQARKFYESQPYFYDRAGLWWLWSFDSFSWQMTDETDLLNGIRDALNVDTIQSRDRSEIIAALKQEGRRKIPENPPASWVQFRKTIIDIKTGEQFEASPKYFICNPIPWDLGDSEDTPTIDRLFREWVVDVSQDESYLKTLQEVTAYACTRHKFLQRIIALTGAGSNGKGTYLQFLQNLIGKSNTCTSELKELSSRFETSALYRKLLCIMGEVSADDMASTNILKKLTGEDLIRYEFKGKTSFSETSATTCVISTNSLPTTPDTSIGFFRRWMVIDFPHQFPIKADLLAQIPEVEYQNMCCKVVRILGELYARGEFTNGGSYADREARYEERSNPLSKFLECFCEEDSTENIRLRDFATKFNEYLRERKLRVLTVRKISSMLKRDGYDVGQRKISVCDSDEKVSSCVVTCLRFLDKPLLPSKPSKSQIDSHVRPSLNYNGFDGNNGKPIISSDGLPLIKCEKCGSDKIKQFTDFNFCLDCKNRTKRENTT